MSLFGKKKKAQDTGQEYRTKDFFDCILPGTIKFFANSYIMGDTYRCVWVIREYPPTTEEQAILAQLADRTGVTLRLYHRRVTPVEEKQIVNNAARKNRLMSGDHDITQAMEAEGNLQDVQTLLATMRNNREILLHCSVYMELKAKSMETLEQLQSQIAMELTRAKITVDKLTLRQQEGFLSVLPFGRNQFGDQYERVLPAGSVANMYPLSFSGKTDPKGFYVGRDKYGTNILVDLDRRSNDKTNGSALILGNSGQGKSYLMKLLLTNFRESGKAVICLDVEAEYEDLTENLGGCYVDYMTGQYIINPLEPKAWSADGDEIDEESPEAFRKVTRLSQHIAFLKDFFRSYKDFTDAQVDTMEILLEKLYAQRGILSYMSNRLIGIGNSVASIDELYLFLTNQTAIEYIRNSMKRVRKKDSCVVLASQNIEDFLIPSIREFTKPMFSIPTHQFLFYPGAINPKDYMDALQVDEAEYDLIRNPDRGACLYRCGGERYYLQVQVPDYKEALFGKAGGR